MVGIKLLFQQPIRQVHVPLTLTQFSTNLYFCASLLTAQLQQLQSLPCSLLMC